MENIIVPKFVIEMLENTLRITANLKNSYNKETCYDRDVIQCLICCRKLLKNIEINGGERMEELKNMEEY